MVEDLNSAQEFSKTQTCFLFDLQPSFNPSGAQNALSIIHDPKQCGLTTQHEQGLPGTPGGTRGRKQGDASPE